jgi:hypothetical protein
MHFDPVIDDAPGFVPETMLPEQFFRLSATLSPEKRLMLAVLEGALLDLRQGVGTGTPRAGRRGADADAWFASDDDGWPFALVNVCHALALDASAVRSRLAPWRRELRAKLVRLRVRGKASERAATDATARLASAG